MKLLVEGKGMAMEHVLVIGYGNPLRSDDGIAWQAAEKLKREFDESAKVMCVHQLTPELAADICQTDMVIFLDASSKGEPGDVRCEAVSEEPGELRFSHHLTPAEVLTLSDRLYSAKPRAFLISMHGECFDHGSTLSPAAIHAVPEVVAQVCTLMKQLNRQSGGTEPSKTTLEGYAL
jgi:hydrogenase maturation protease